jgi:hypothetical protein
MPGGGEIVQPGAPHRRVGEVVAFAATISY